MVEKEEKELSADEMVPLIQGAVIKRAPNGDWTLLVRLLGDIVIDTERALPINAELRTKAKQRGKRGNPAQNWAKGGGFLKKGETR